ncbi:MAG: hypothetical protein KDA29_03310 [Phycisphaerales bacterium]|nr:hypothetical protein [Phycisphaerales bacterium]
MKKELKIAGVVSLVLVLLAVGLGAWAYNTYFSPEPLSEAELADLVIDWDIATGGNWSPWWDRGDGKVEWNPTASYNEWIASLTDDEKAWGIIAVVYADYFDSLLGMENMGTLPTDPERWATIEEVLGSEESDAVMAMLMEGLNRPHMGAMWGKDTDPVAYAAFNARAERDPEAWDPGELDFDPDENVDVLGSSRAWLGWHSLMTNFVSSKAAYELERGNTDEFVDAMIVLVRSSDLSRAVPEYVALFFEIGIEARAIDTIDWALRSHREVFTEAHFARLEEALSSYAGNQFIWQGEMLQFEDTLRRICGPNGHLSERAAAQVAANGMGLGKPVHLPVEKLGPTMQRMLLVMRRMGREMDASGALPWDDPAAAIRDPYEAQVEFMSPVAQTMLDILIPALERGPARSAQHRQVVIGIRLGISAERHLERHGEYPDSIDGIDADLLALEPVDIFSGEKLHYEIFDGRPYIYSIGPDRIDNGGVVMWIEKEYNGTTYMVREPVEMMGREQVAVRFSDERDQSDWPLYLIPPNDPEPLGDADDSDYDLDWDLEQDESYEEEHGEQPVPDDG